MAQGTLRPVRVGITEKNANPYWDMVNAGWADGAQALGLELRIDAPEREDVDAQLRLMRRQLEDGVDLLAFVATRPDAFDGIVAEAAARGVPALAFDLDAPTSGRLAFVGMPEIRDAARQLGELLADRIPAGATVIAQTGSRQAPGAVAKLTGFLDVMSDLGHPVVVADSDDEDVPRSQQVARDLLGAHPEAAGMFGVYGYHPIVQAHAAQALGRRDVQIVGFDMLPETVNLLEQGTVACSVWIQEYYFGLYSAVLANALARIGSDVLGAFGMDPAYPPRNTLCPPVAFITRETVGRYRDFETSKSLRTRTAPTAV